MYVFYSKLAVHGRVADLRCVWVARMQGAEENETKPFCLIKPAFFKLPQIKDLRFLSW